MHAVKLIKTEPLRNIEFIHEGTRKLSGSQEILVLFLFRYK